jgi:penicillin G amidase
MRILKTGLSFLITLLLVYSLDRGWTLASPIPPLGKFLDPFHGFWHNAESSKPKDRALSMKGLMEPVTVTYDSVGIPHIFAKNDDDLYQAQGYVTAMDRLWQMEFQTHAAAGRISEIVGPAALDFDRRQRRLGMVYGAQMWLSIWKPILSAIPP